MYKILHKDSPEYPSLQGGRQQASPAEYPYEYPLVYPSYALSHPTSRSYAHVTLRISVSLAHLFRLKPNPFRYIIASMLTYARLSSHMRMYIVSIYAPVYRYNYVYYTVFTFYIYGFVYSPVWRSTSAMTYCPRLPFDYSISPSSRASITMR